MTGQPASPLCTLAGAAHSGVITARRAVRPTHATHATQVFVHDAESGRRRAASAKVGFTHPKIDLTLLQLGPEV